MSLYFQKVINFFISKKKRSQIVVFWVYLSVCNSVSSCKWMSCSVALNFVQSHDSYMCVKLRSFLSPRHDVSKTHLDCLLDRFLKIKVLKITMFLYRAASHFACVLHKIINDDAKLALSSNRIRNPFSCI